jgi:hypothetical protein
MFGEVVPARKSQSYSPPRESRRSHHAKHLAEVIEDEDQPSPKGFGLAREDRSPPLAGR